MIGFISFLAGSKIGRWAAFVALAALGAWVAKKSLMRAGGLAERAKQSEATIKSLQAGLRATNETVNMSKDDRRKYLSGWVSDGNKHK